MAMNPTNAVDDGRIVLPVLKEELHVGVKPVDTGRGVRVHKTVTEQVQHINETLTHHAVDVRRVAIDQIVALNDAPVARQEGDTWIVPILEEVLVVEKRLRIKEEIHITKTAHQEQFSDSVVVRSEHVAVERFDEGSEPTTNSTNGGHHATHTRSRI
ncbi:MAG: YsnF/AvaK domain-containing protein [Pseudomonadota bacterium]